MAIIYNSGKTADTVNRAIDNSMGTTTTTQGAAAAGKIITEDLQPVVQCTGGYTNPVTVKTISGVPPVEFHAVERDLKSWSIYGNTVEGVSVGDKTVNLLDITTIEKGRIDSGDVNYASQTTELLIEGNTVYFTTTATYRGVCSDFIEIPSTGKITFNFTTNLPLGVKFCFYDNDKTWLNADVTPVITDIPPATVSIPEGAKYVRLSFTGQRAGGADYTMTANMLNVGDNALPYEPYNMYKVPITCAGITYNCYISDVLRKSAPVERKRKSKKAVNDTTVYDIMDSTGTVTRNVDTDGTPLETPVTETYTAPTITTIWGYNEFDVDTTVTPSNVTVEYYDN